MRFLRNHSHPALALVVAVLAVAAAVAGYISRANLSQLAPATTAGSAVIKPAPTESAAKARDTVIWRDETGAIYRAKIGGGRFDEFLRQRKGPLEAARSESRDQAAAEILAAMKPVFADIKARVPGYADWYFGYFTKYELMVHAFLPAIVYLGRSLDFSSPPDKSLIQEVGPHVVEYLEQQYADRVVRPREAEIRLRAAFDTSYGVLRAHWGRVVDEQRGAMRALIKEQAGSAERLSADQAAGVELDWDGGRDQGSAMHEEGIVDRLSARIAVGQIEGPDVSQNTGQARRQGKNSRGNRRSHACHRESFRQAHRARRVADG